nr:uncharacterized protein LOC131782824 [Pocillopora verrucosa]
MPSHYNCCVPLCTNHSRKNRNLSFHRIPKDESLRKNYTRSIRNKTLKLESSHTRICSAHFEGGKKKYSWQLPSIFPWSKPCKERKLPTRRALGFNDVLSETDLAVGAEFEFEAVEAGVVKDNQETVESETLSVEANNVLSAEVNCAKSQETQTDTNEDKCEEQKEMEEQIKILQEKISALKIEVHKREFCIKRFQSDNESISFYTGFPNYETLMACFEFVANKAQNMSYGKYDRKLFNTSALPSLLVQPELEPLINWPHKEQIVDFMPAIFKAKYPDVVVIIDCTEIKMETPSALDNQSACYSYYKSNTNMKGLVGITPSGVCSFVSDLYTGSISDKEIIIQSGFLDKLSKGDGVMADKGFLIQDELAARQAHLVIPPLLKKKPQFSEEELDSTRSIANLRIHVERCMERIKNYHIFDRAFPISMADSASDIFVVICALVNFLPPLVK